MPRFCPIADSDTNRIIGIWAEQVEYLQIDGALEADLHPYSNLIRNALNGSKTRVVENDETDVGMDVVFSSGTFVMFDEYRAPNEELEGGEHRVHFVHKNHDGVGILWRTYGDQSSHTEETSPLEEGDTIDSLEKKILKTLQQKQIRSENLSISEILEWGNKDTVVPILEKIKNDPKSSVRLEILTNTIIVDADDVWKDYSRSNCVAKKQSTCDGDPNRESSDPISEAETDNRNPTQSGGEQPVSWWRRLFRYKDKRASTTLLTPTEITAFNAAFESYDTYSDEAVYAACENVTALGATALQHMVAAVLAFEPNDPNVNREDTADAWELSRDRAQYALSVISDIGGLQHEDASRIFARLIEKREWRAMETAGLIGIHRQALDTLERCGFTFRS